MSTLHDRTAGLLRFPSCAVVRLLLALAVAALCAPPVPAEDRDLILETIEIDVRSATYYELVAWCNRLGLSMRGNRAELEQRVLAHYSVEGSTDDAGEERVITIERADSTEYFTLEESDERYVRFLGGVRLVTEDADSGTRHEITADSIVFNQDLNSLTATGNVEYVLDQSGETERFTGESLTFNLDNWEGVFILGTSATERTIEEQTMTFYYKGRTIYRLTDDRVLLYDGTITSSDPDDPYYRIDAGTIFVLAPQEWALSDGVLYLGHVPVLYLPLFFHPGDEVVFHPSFGVDEVTGYFLQTTTYLIGRRPQESDSLSFLQITDQESADYNTTLEGIFLRKSGATGTDDAQSAGGDGASGRSSGASEDRSLKVLADMYSGLGLFVGLEGMFPSLWRFESLEFSVGLARSRNLYQTEGRYTYLKRDDEGIYSAQWNESEFLGLQFPFRYCADVSFSLALKPLSLEFDIPVYSDPYFARDFFDRKERMDWAGLLGIDEGEDAETNAGSVPRPAVMDRLTWLLNARVSPDVSALRPYIQSAQVSRLDVSARWRSKELPEDDIPDIDTRRDDYYRDPQRKFYYPDSVVTPSFAAQISGSLLKRPSAPSSGTSSRDDRAETQRTDIPEPEPPWGSEAEPKEESNTDADTPPEERTPGVEKTLRVPERRPPIRIPRPSLPVPYTHDLTYSVGPTFTLDSKMNSSQWIRPGDIDFAAEYSIVNARFNSSLKYSGAVLTDLIRLTDNVAFSGSYRDHFNVADVAMDRSESYDLQDRQASWLKLTDTLSLTALPLSSVDALKSSALRYEIAALFYHRHYDAEVEDYTVDGVEWTKDAITKHTAGVEVKYDTPVGAQSLTFGTSLPPRDGEITAKLQSTAGPLFSSLAFGAKRPDNEEDPPEWVYDPFVWTEKLSFLDRSYLQHALSYDIDENKLVDSKGELYLSALENKLNLKQTVEYDYVERALAKLSTSAQVFWLRAQYDWLTTRSSTFVPGVGWRLDDEERFQAARFSLNAAYTAPKQYFWKNRISVEGGVEGAWNLNLLRVTDSSLTFGVSLKLFVSEFLDLTFSSKSQNRASYLYIPALAERMPQQTWLNPIVDIARSFNFFNPDDRKEASFNLSSVSVKATHRLRDWNLNIEYTGKPEQSTSGGANLYKWNGRLSLFVQWLPIPEVKRRVTVDDDVVDF